MSNGFVFYEGQSLHDGGPIVGICTIRSTNRKTGDMAQTWIMRSDMSPVRAVKGGYDESICGECLHRGSAFTGGVRTCYVNVGHAPLAIMKAYDKGLYPRQSLAVGMAAHAISSMRIGSYGEPTVIPFEAWEGIGDLRMRSGYTHRWNQCDERWRNYIMASCDDVADVELAEAFGWRAFLTAKPGDDRPGYPYLRMVECPGNKGVQCASCGACDGAGSKPHIWIQAHGPASSYWASGEEATR